MAERSLTATPEGIQQINRALTARGWSREDLMEECGCSRQPAIKFCSGKAVSNKLFVSFCNVLKLDWEEIAGRKAASRPDETKEPETDIDVLVQTVRAKVHGDIQARCGTMRVLDMEQPIGLGDIYTSVNILEKLSGRRRLGLDELLQDCDLENFDRFTLGQVRHERVPGLEAVERHSQLMILGKPGAGKTTFMKRLAILCNQGEFQPQRVPVFVTLKDYAEAPGQPTLQAYIQRQCQACGVEAANALSTVLGTGQALVLLDGLDEVYETDHDRVLQDIKTFAHQFRDCQCVITCRIAAREYIFEQFTEVEVADFDKEQIAEFAAKWFVTRDDPIKAETFIRRLNDNQPIQELATNPLLLTLLCLIFGEAADFPANRSELYKEGLDVLLKKWDSKRNIERDQVYKKLSLKRKEDLLGQLACTTFEQGDYFFKQATVEQHIMQYIRNLPGTSDDEESLQLDSEAILKSIESQHGLLIERARRIYSFSHLTFQEYFTAQCIINSAHTPDRGLKGLAIYVANRRYREVLLLTCEMLHVADPLVFLMKEEIDKLLSSDSEIQMFLAWIFHKSKATDLSHEPCSIRALYFSLCLAYQLASYRDRALADILDLDIDFSLSSAFNLDMASANNFSSAFGIDSSPQKITYNGNEEDVVNESYYFDIEEELGGIEQVLDLILDQNLDASNEEDVEFIFERFLSINQTLEELKQESECDHDLLCSVNLLDRQFPEKIFDGLSDFRNWWIRIGGEWAKNLRLITFRFRQVDYYWDFSAAQKESLQSYRDANRLLVDCLNSDCYVTKATRQYIEDTLLLPLSEIEKYPVPDAIANL